MLTSLLMGFITQIALINGIQPEVALAVADYESNFKIQAIGSKGEIGLFQIMPSNYKELNKLQLMEPYTNITLGIKMLAHAKKYCKHKQRHNWLVCYNAGIKNAKKIKYPEKFKYVVEVEKRLAHYKKEGRMQKYNNGQKIQVFYSNDYYEGIYLEKSFKHKKKHFIVINERMLIEVDNDDIILEEQEVA